jgi:hypothetical protein
MCPFISCERRRVFPVSMCPFSSPTSFLFDSHVCLGMRPFIFSLTVITLTVCVLYTTVFEYQNQVILNMTLFLTVVPRCQIDTCF